jgi:hypothetical protein
VVALVLAVSMSIASMMVAALNDGSSVTGAVV